MRLRRTLCAALLAGIQAVRLPPRPAAATASRRDVLALLECAAAACVAAPARPAAAFENAIPEFANYADKAKRRGTPPKDLGMASRTINADSIDEDPKTFMGLRGCVASRYLALTLFEAGRPLTL